MRRLAMVLIFALPLYGYEVSSPRYKLAFAIERGGDMVIYVVGVTDVKTGKILLSDRMVLHSGKSEMTFLADYRKLRVAIREAEGKLSAELDVEQDGVILDLLRATWLAAPRPVRLPNDGPFRVGGDVKAPVVSHRVEPRYTAEAKASRISGVVILELVIDREGNVRDAKVLKPLPLGLDEMAIVAVKQWKFRPGTLDGEPVDVIFNITMNFKLDE